MGMISIYNHKVFKSDLLGILEHTRGCHLMFDKDNEMII